MHIPYIVEPSYAKSIWAEKTIIGMKKEANQRKYNLLELDGAHYKELSSSDSIFSENHMVLVIGTSYTWVSEVIAHLHEQNVSAIVLNYDPPEYLRPIGIVHIDYTQAMHLLMDYLHACGKSHIALYGLNPNSSTDIMKKSCIEALYPNCSDHIFYNEASLSECYQHFKAVSAQFDAVICTNDIVAASLLFHLREDHISVPEQLFITCLGNSTLAAKIKPGITTVSLDHFEMGRQAIKLYAWLSRQEQQTCVSVRIRAQLTVRNSTAMIPASKVTTASLPSQKSVDFYSDPEAQKLFAAEQLLSTATETDFLIMQGLLTGLNQEELQDRLFLSDSSLRYHIRYLMKSAGVKNRHEFLAFLQTWQELLYYK